jgi:hypothetical protein
MEYRRLPHGQRDLEEVVLMGGKPSKGTKSDKRLKGNKGKK